MIATTSVPAVWALTGLVVGELVVLCYIGIFFGVMFIMFWGMVQFAKMIRSYLGIKYYD